MWLGHHSDLTLLFPLFFSAIFMTSTLHYFNWLAVQISLTCISFVPDIVLFIILIHFPLQHLHIITRASSSSFTYCSSPQSTLMADALLTCAAENTEFLMMNVTSETKSHHKSTVWKIIIFCLHFTFIIKLIINLLKPWLQIRVLHTKTHPMTPEFRATLN